MKIAIEHNAPLPVTKYGGTERIIYWLMKELVRSGHKVVLIGHPSSRVRDIGVELVPQRPEVGPDWRTLVPKDVDLVHTFYKPPFTLDLPSLVTIQGNGRKGEVFQENTVFVSRRHAENHGAQAFVYNGLDLEEYPWSADYERRKGWMDFMFLAKASWKVKNLKDCAWACRKAKKRLHIGGGRWWRPSRYVRSYGMIDLAVKEKLFSRCQALLFPVRWHEPFGIAMIEAQAAGMAVAGTPYGSLPEVILPGTGKICASKDELLAFVAQEEAQAHYAPRVIRAHVEERFSSKTMARAYVDCYQKILAGEKLNPASPQWKLPQDAQDLLPF